MNKFKPNKLLIKDVKAILKKHNKYVNLFTK